MLIGIAGGIPFNVSNGIDRQIAALFAQGEKGVHFDPSDFSTLFQDSAGTIPVTAVGQSVGKILDKSGNGFHATQTTSTARPILGRHPIIGRRNLLDATDALATQAYTTAAVAYTLSFTGTGTITLSGAYVGSLVGTGASNRVSLTFTSTAASLTLTVSGSVTFAQLETGSILTAYQSVVSTYNVTEAGVNNAYYLKFDGIDDFMVTSSIDFSATDKMSVFAGIYKPTPNQWGMICELSVNAGATNGGFYLIDGSNLAAGNQFASLSRGTIATVANTTAIYAGGTNYVISSQHNISGDSTTIRVNSVTNGSVATDKGTGNFTTNPLYIGMRAGSSIPFGGQLYSLIVRGALSNASQISTGEVYCNSKTGAY